MNISKYEQRTLRALAQGGRIEVRKNEKGDIVEIDCFNRDGWRLEDCTLAVFRKLRRRRLIRSQEWPLSHHARRPRSRTATTRQQVTG